MKRKPLEFHNVIRRSITEGQNIGEELDEVRLNLLQKGVFMNGPLLLEGKWSRGFTHILIPTNARVEFVEHTEFSFEEVLRCEDGIFHRDGEEEFNEEAHYMLLQRVAEDLGVELTDHYYCIVLNVYGGELYDIYAPIKSEV